MHSSEIYITKLSVTKFVAMTRA